MDYISPRHLLPSFITMPPSPLITRPVDIPIDTVIHFDENGKIRTEENEKDEEKEETVEAECKIDSLFYRVCWICFALGVNFYRRRAWWQRLISTIVVGFNVLINVYFIFYVVYLMLSKPFNPDTLATSLGVTTWTLQATLSTLFLAYWQSTAQACRMLKQLYDAHKGVGIQHYRKELRTIVHYFYVVLVLIIIYSIVNVRAYFMGKELTFLDKDIERLFGDRRLFIIFILANTYTILCWGVALFVFSLLVHSTNYEFLFFNNQVRSIRCEKMYRTDEDLCNYLLRLIKVHSQLTECVKRLDRMFHRYAFVMIASIIPTTIFSLFMVFRKGDQPFAERCGDFIFSAPLVFFCIFSFFALTNGPSQLHDTIYTTKSALCANTHIWFPYRPAVYHSALAFVCHLDQTNLGISIWGFAVVSKPLVLTTLSVMVTCLALFLQVGECKV